MKFGDPVPDIVGETTQGGHFRLSDHRGKFVVIYFFPKAFTPGCTRETERFRDAFPELTALGAMVVGISVDAHEVQCDFASQLGVPFPMLGDPEAKIVEAYGVKWPIFKVSQRATFIVDPEGKLAGFFHHELRFKQHVDDVVNFLQKVQTKRRAGA